MKESCVLGIIANPAKISGDFLLFLKRRMEIILATGLDNISFRFIDKRYHYHPLRHRITAALQSNSAVWNEKPIGIDFVVPKGHCDYLNEVARLTAVIDTFPYTGGLTTIEALSLGVPCLTKVGKLFSERHSYSHCRYAGMEEDQFDLEKNFSEKLHLLHLKESAKGNRSSLISSSSKRLDHEALAKSIIEQF